MRRPLAFLVLGVALAGCAAPAAAPVGPAPDAAAPSPAPVETLEWSGLILADATGELAHTRPASDALENVQEVGFTAEVPEGVTAMEVALRWDGPGALDILLHSHDHERNVIVHHQSATDEQNPKCIRVPAADLAPGAWEFMSRHSQGAANTRFTLTVLTVGGVPTILDEPHGHQRVDEALQGTTRDLREVEACALWAP